MKLRLSAVCAILMLAWNSSAALDMFLKLDQIPGESTLKGHEKEIDVLAFSWGMSNPAVVSTGGGGITTGKAQLQELSLTKYVDLSSPPIMASTAQGKHIATAILTVGKSGASAALANYYTITLTDVVVTSVSTGASGGEDRMTENITLSYAKIKIDYYQQKPDGSTILAGSFSWDLTQNQL